MPVHLYTSVDRNIGHLQVIIDCKTAMDITPLSLYPSEKESLLAPGTQLKVKSRKR